MNRYLLLAIFLVAVVGGGLALGYLIQPGAWYASLRKPPFTPPDIVFGPVWTILYVMIAVAGWRTWLREPGGTAMKLWFAQLALNFFWTPVFFGENRAGWALIVIMALLVAIVAFVVAVLPRDRVAALLFVPYAVWVAFATALNASIFLLNR